MMCQAPQDAVPLVGWVTQAMLRSAFILLWPLLAVLLAVLPGCGAKVDLAAERHAKAVKALIDLGAEVRDVEDEVTHDRGTYVILFREHFTSEGRVREEVLKLTPDAIAAANQDQPGTDDAPETH